MIETEEPEGAEDAGTPEGWGAFVPDFFKRVAVAGLGAILMTEEGIRSLAGQLKLPKEALGFIVSQAERTKAEVGRVVSEEVRRFLQSDTLRQEFLKLLTGMTLEIKAEVRLHPQKKKSHHRLRGDGAAVETHVVVGEVGARRTQRKRKA